MRMISAHKIFAAIRVGREQCKRDIEREKERQSALHIFQVEPTHKYISLLSASRDDKAEEKCKRLSICWPRPQLSLSLSAAAHKSDFIMQKRAAN